MIFVIATLQKTLPERHTLNQRSIRSFLKYHFKDFAELASSLKLVKADDHKEYSRGPSEIVLENINPKSLPLYILLQGQVTIWRHEAQEGKKKGGSNA